MRAVDLVDFLTEVLPRKWVKVGMLAIVAGVLLTGNAAPFLWYVSGKAASAQEHLVQPIIDRMFDDLVAHSAAPGGAP